ncbi:NUDIX hydrolase [Frigidibacter mobilis]|nr:NUDIX hydrolase [Frigidibacter mobilis]
MTSTKRYPMHHAPARPIAAVIAVVLRGLDVLLVRRINPPDAGLWGFPGGKIDPGETLADAALRELYEETGVRASACAVLDALDVLDRDASGVLRHHFILVAVACHWLGGEPLAADDASDAGWFSVMALDPDDPGFSSDVVALARRAAGLA